MFIPYRKYQLILLPAMFLIGSFLMASVSSLSCGDVNDDDESFLNDVSFDGRRFKRSFMPFRSEKFMSKQVRRNNNLTLANEKFTITCTS